MFKQMGHLFVDHRASPGLPEDVARWAGYDPRLSGEGKVFEVDTLRCSHCSNHVVPNPARTRARACCYECDNKAAHYICDPCDFERNQPAYVHAPMAKKIDDFVNVTRMGSPSKLLMP